MPLKCSICLGESSGCHFGAEACRACAAFFRRSITQRKSYRCQGNNNCEVTINIRCFCRACRFSKCLQVGMNPVGVQQRPESARKSLSTNPTTSSPESEDLSPDFKNRIPQLTKMKSNYQKMLNARQIVHKNPHQSLFEERIPRPINYLESIEQAMKEVGLVADWISCCFPDFLGLSADQKNILFRHFYTKFFQLESTFKSHIMNTPDKIILTSGDYIDLNDLEKFYHDPKATKKVMKEDIEKLFKPFFAMQQRCLILPMMSMKMDRFEFFALATIILWDGGLEDLSQETIEKCEEIKDQVMNELIFYMRKYQGIAEPGIRIARLVSLLPAVERCVRKLQDDMEMTHIFNLFKSSQQFYDLVNGNFC